MLDNYLSAEPVIAAHLQANVPDAHAVLSAGDLYGVAAQSQPTPALYVVYMGDRLGDEAGRGQAQVVYQRWMVVVGVRNVRDIQGGSAARNDAGPLISAVIKQISGWAPTTDHGPFARITAPDPVYDAGFAYFPLLFQTRVITS